MPNGGSDCCGTCPFNRKNRGQLGYGGRDNPEPDHCEIRDLPITGAAFWTYCANHPHHNPQSIRIPIGPVYVDAGGFPYGRKVWQPSPDTEEIRAEVLRLITTATPEPIQDYTAGLALVEAAILQAGEFRDLRYVPELDRIRQFAGGDSPPRGSTRDPDRSAAFAARSLALILPPDALRPFVTDTVRALAAGIDQSGNTSGLAVLADALEEAGCTHAPTLDYLRSPAAAATHNPCWVVDVILGRVPAAG
jgi:hypothetical protein